MLETLLSLLEKVSALASAQKDRRRRFFSELVDPLFRDLRIALDDYHTILGGLRERLTEVVRLESQIEKLARFTLEETRARELLADRRAEYDANRARLISRRASINDEYVEQARTATPEWIRGDGLRLRAEWYALGEALETSPIGEPDEWASDILDARTRRIREPTSRRSSILHDTLRELRGCRETHARTRVQIGQMAIEMRAAARGGSELDDDLRELLCTIERLFLAFDSRTKDISGLTDLLELLDDLMTGAVPAATILERVNGTVHRLESGWRTAARLHARLKLQYVGS